MSRLSDPKSDTPPSAEVRRPATISFEHVVEWFHSLSHIERSVASSIVDNDSFVMFYFALLKEERVCLARDHCHLLFPKDYLLHEYCRNSDKRKKHGLPGIEDKDSEFMTSNHSNDMDLADGRNRRSDSSGDSGSEAAGTGISMRQILRSTVDRYCQSAIFNVTSKLISANTSGISDKEEKHPAKPVPCDKSGAAFEKSFDIFNKWQREMYCSFLTGGSTKHSFDTVVLDIKLLSDSKAFFRQLKCLSNNAVFTRFFSEEDVKNAKRKSNFIKDVAWFYSVRSGDATDSFVTIYHILVAMIEINIWDAFYKTFQHMKKKSVVANTDQYLAHFRTKNEVVLEGSKKSESFLTILSADYSGSNETVSSLSIMAVSKSYLTCLPSWSVLMTLFCELEEICEYLRSLSQHAYDKLFSRLISMDGGCARATSSAEKSESVVINKLVFLEIDKMASMSIDVASFVQAAHEVVLRVKSSAQLPIPHSYRYSETVHHEPDGEPVAAQEEEPALRMKQRLIDIKPSLTADSLKRRGKGTPVETQPPRPEPGAEDDQEGRSAAEYSQQTEEEASQEMLRFNRSLKKEIEVLLSPADVSSGNKNGSESTSSDNNSEASDNENFTSSTGEKKKGKKKCKKKKKKKKSATWTEGEASGEDKGSSKEEAEEVKVSELAPSPTEPESDGPVLDDGLCAAYNMDGEDSEDFVKVSNRKTMRLNKSKSQLDGGKAVKATSVNIVLPGKPRQVSAAAESMESSAGKIPASAPAPIQGIQRVPSYASITSNSAGTTSGTRSNSGDGASTGSAPPTNTKIPNGAAAGTAPSEAPASSSKPSKGRTQALPPDALPAPLFRDRPVVPEAAHATIIKPRRASAVLENKVDNKVTLLQRKLTKNIRTFNKVMSTRMEAHKLTQVGLHIQLRSMVLSLWPHAIVRIYGSCITGLALPSSDIDVVIQLTDRSDHVHSDVGDRKLSCASDDEGWDSGNPAAPVRAGVDGSNAALDQLLSDRNKLLQHNANMKYTDEPSVERRKPSSGSSKSSSQSERAPSPIVAHCVSKQEVVGGLFALVGHLYMHPWASNVNPIPTAQIPLIKLRVASGIMLSLPALQSKIVSIYSDQVHGAGDSELDFGCLPKVFVPSSSDTAYAAQQQNVAAESGSVDDAAGNGARTPSLASAFIEGVQMSPQPPRDPMLPFHLAQDVNIAVDITFEAGEHKGISTCDLIQAHLRTRSPVLPMVVKVIKELLRQAGFNMPYDGGLSSYSIFLMVLAAYDLYFLEESRALSESTDAKILTQTKAAQQTLISNKLTEGALLLYFLKLYGHVFDASKHGIDIMSDKILHELTAEQRLQVGTSGWITDPLDPTKNVARPSFAFRQIQLLLAQCLEAFEWEISLSSKEFLLTGKDNDTDLIKMFIRY